MDSERKQLEAARRVKPKAAEAMKKFGHVTGVGITRHEGVYAVKVNLEDAPDCPEDLPEEIDGVPLVVRALGKIYKQKKK